MKSTSLARRNGASLLATVALIALAASAPSTAGPKLSSAVAPVQESSSINSVTFSGSAGTGKASPTVTVTGSGFGASAPAAVSDNVTSCGTYSANGQVFGNQLYFVDNANFLAGYGPTASGGATCIGIVVTSWSPTRVVFKFGSAYDSFARWYLVNGDGFALSLRGATYTGRVVGLNSCWGSGPRACRL